MKNPAYSPGVETFANLTATVTVSREGRLLCYYVSHEGCYVLETSYDKTVHFSILSGC